MDDIEIIKSALMTFGASGYVPIPPDHFKSFEIEVTRSTLCSLEKFYMGRSYGISRLKSTSKYNVELNDTAAYYVQHLANSMSGRWSYEVKHKVGTNSKTIILTIYVENEADELNYRFTL